MFGYFKEILALIKVSEKSSYIAVLILFIVIIGISVISNIIILLLLMPSNMMAVDFEIHIDIKDIEKQQDDFNIYVLTQYNNTIEYNNLVIHKKMHYFKYLIFIQFIQLVLLVITITIFNII